MNEPAFPSTTVPNAQAKAFGGATDSHWPGMTLRDYFAAKAMQGIQIAQTVGAGGGHQQRVAEAAYAMADAMLKARLV